MTVGLLFSTQHARRTCLAVMPAQDGTDMLTGGTAEEVGTFAAVPDDLGQCAAG